MNFSVITVDFKNQKVTLQIRNEEGNLETYSEVVEQIDPNSEFLAMVWADINDSKLEAYQKNLYAELTDLTIRGLSTREEDLVVSWANLAYSKVLSKRTAEEKARQDPVKYGISNLRDLRRARNKKLSQTDWTQMLDADLSQPAVKAWADYRQKLRELTDGVTEVTASQIQFPPEPDMARFRKKRKSNVKSKSKQDP